MSNSDERLVAEIDPQLKSLVKADNRTIREIVEASLWREYGGADRSAVKREITEKENRLVVLAEEIEEREDEMAEIERQLKALRAKLGEIEDNESEEELHREQLIDSLESSEARENNANVIRVARELDTEPSEVVDIMVERFDKERKDSGDIF